MDKENGISIDEALRKGKELKSQLEEQRPLLLKAYKAFQELYLDLYNEDIEIDLNNYKEKI